MYAHHTLTCLLCHIPSPQAVLNGSLRPAPKQHHMTPADIKDRIFMHCFFPETQEFYFLCSRTVGNRIRDFAFSLHFPEKNTVCSFLCSWLPVQDESHDPWRNTYRKWDSWSISDFQESHALVRAYLNFLVFWSQDKSNKHILHIYLLFQFKLWPQVRRLKLVSLEGLAAKNSKLGVLFDVILQGLIFF